MCHGYYRKNRNFRWGLIIVGKQHPWKLNPRNVYTRKISDGNYDGLLSPRKFIPLENFTHEILWPRKFLCLQYSVLLQISRPRILRASYITTVAISVHVSGIKVSCTIHIIIYNRSEGRPCAPFAFTNLVKLSAVLSDPPSVLPVLVILQSNITYTHQTCGIISSSNLIKMIRVHFCMSVHVQMIWIFKDLISFLIF